MTKSAFVDHVLFTCHDANCYICVISSTLSRTIQLGSIVISIYSRGNVDLQRVTCLQQVRSRTGPKPKLFDPKAQTYIH